MGVMKYELELSDQYEIRNYFGPKCRSMPIEDDPWYTNPGIRMTVEGDYDLEQVIAHCADNGDRPEKFWGSWQEALRGGESPWKLATVGVWADSVTLHFTNDSLHREWCEAREKGIGGHPVDYEDWVILDNIREHFIGLKLCFTVPIPGSTEESKTTVEVLEKVIRITESGFRSCRELLLEETYGLASTSAVVTEYTW